MSRFFYRVQRPKRQWGVNNYCTVASSRVDSKTQPVVQYSISYPVQNDSKRFRIFFHAVYQSTEQTDHSKPFSNRKIRKKIENCIKQHIEWTVLIHDPASDESVSNEFLDDSFQSKTWIPWIFWQFRPLLATSGTFWPLLTPSGHFWPLFWRINISGRHYERNFIKKTITW